MDLNVTHTMGFHLTSHKRWYKPSLITALIRLHQCGFMRGSYRPQTNQELCLMQQVARALRAFAQEFNIDRSHYFLKYEQAKYELEEQRHIVSALDDENQELTDQVCSLATSNVQASVQRDDLVDANIDLRKVSHPSYMYGLVFGLSFMVLFVAFIIGHLLP